MKNVIDFLSAALPWITMGLLLAIFFARSSKKKKKVKESDEAWDREDDYGTEGMCLGMCLGAAINASYGLSIGMLLGLVIGSCIKKDKNDSDD